MLLGELYHGDAVTILGQAVGRELDPRRTICMTEPPWPVDPRPEAAAAWAAVAAILPVITDRLVVWLGHRTDPRWIVEPIPAGIPFLETKWLEARSPGGQRLTAAELVMIFGREAWPCGGSVFSDVVSRTTRPWPKSCGIGHARQLVATCVPEGWTVLDPFCGTGTMLVAAAEAGRHFVGIEHDADTFEITTARLQALEDSPS